MCAAILSRAMRRRVLPAAAMVAAAAVAVGAGVRVFYLPHKPAQEGTAVTGTSVSAAQQPGSPTVRMTSDAAAHPDGEETRGMLQQFFDSINQRNYEQWKTTVTRERVRITSESTWRFEYGSTKDGSILVHRIEPGPDEGLRALVSFTSTQHEDRAPLELKAGCVRWRLVYYLVRDNGALKMDARPPGSPPVERC